ncbi:MAG: PadR family transcriptional regulator [Acidobacteria bacterium]|nr:MAG: PadR family transcriptional regulator [Acidobacteriota bacterium]REK08714.1 MAG: PadR family transcriptional regulator [Acidobacteriota bacterium]
MPGAKPAAAARTDALLRGTLDLLILRSLRGVERHGYGIAEWIEAATGDELRILEGTIYPALHRMEKRGWIRSQWGPSENNRRAKFYALTEEGERRQEDELDRWRRYAAAMERALAVAVEVAPRSGATVPAT